MGVGSTLMVRETTKYSFFYEFPKFDIISGNGVFAIIIRGLYSSLYRHIHAYKILLILASGAQVFFFALALRPGGIMAPQIGGFCGSVAF